MMRKALKDGGKPELKIVSRQDDGPNPTPPAKIDLRDAHAIRRELGSVYRDMRAGRIPSQDGTRFAHVLNSILQAYEKSELQARLERVEETLRMRRPDYET
jgi:hypothetical protein